jgi:HoxN/HupN/NixA family high-affinity nickel-transporter
MSRGAPFVEKTVAVPGLGQAGWSKSCRTSLVGPFLVVGGVNAAAWFSLAVLASAGGGALFGAGVLAYVLGLRHGFDADHIAAIDNITRKFRQDGRRTAWAGLFFALGHSTVVMLLSLIAVFAARFSADAGRWLQFGLHSMVGTLCSAGFLTLIGIVNVGIFRRLWAALSAMRSSSSADMSGEAIDALLDRRGVSARLFCFLYRGVDAGWKMYPIGFLFGLSFDTASEIAILGLSTAAALHGGLPLWSVMVLPLLFTAGMSLVDTFDGILMMSIYDWVFADAARKLRFNLLLTGLPTGLALLVAGCEWLKLIVAQLRLEGPLPQALDHIGSAQVGMLATAVIIAAWLFSRQRYLRLLRQGHALTRRVIIGVSSALVALLARHPAMADGERRTALTVRGHVIDTLKRALPGVQIELERADQKLVARTESDEHGDFILERVTAGVFAIVGRKSGFKPAIVIIKVSDTKPTSSVTLTLESEQPLSVPIKASRLPSQVRLSSTGASQYTLTERDINELPAGNNTPINGVLYQMPGVALDLDQQFHVRGEHADVQWQINGVMLPLDITTEPGFGQFLNSRLIRSVSLLDGILPAQYGYREAGVIDIRTKNGCEQPLSVFTTYGGMRETAEPSFEWAGCKGKLSYYVTGYYEYSDRGLDSATPAPTPIHDYTNQGQGFGYFTYDLSPSTRLSLITGLTMMNNQFPNVPGQPALYNLAGVNPAAYPSTAIDSGLEQDDYFGVLALNGTVGPAFSYQLAYASHYNTQLFTPDPIGDMIYQGVASRVSHSDFANSLQGDATYQLTDSHTLGFGFYAGRYIVGYNNYSLVFPVNSQGQQTSDVPLAIPDEFHGADTLLGVYVQDIWQVTEKLRATYGARFDQALGFVQGNQISPTINLLYQATKATSLHAGFARYFQVPPFAGLAPVSFQKFAGTTAALSEVGNPFPLPERDYYWDVGTVSHLTPNLTVGQDSYFRLSRNYLDEGQFGFVPIYIPFNYEHGYGWGFEQTLAYNRENLTVRLNFTAARDEEMGVASGQYNFSAAELAYMADHYFILDHEPLFGASGGLAYRWGKYMFSVDGIFSSGLRGGFANEEQLPIVWWLNLGVGRSFYIPGVGEAQELITLINMFDRTNLIRPSTGIGFFEAAYGPRLALYNAITVPLPSLASTPATQP